MFGKGRGRIFLWVVIAIAVTGVLVSLFWGGSGKADFSSDGPRTVYLGIWLVVLLASLVAARPSLGDVGKGIALWGGLGVLLVAGYAYKEELSSVGNRTLAVLIPGYAVTDSSTDGTVTLYRRSGGHFTVNGEIDGKQVSMLVDTGASGVVLTHADAKRVGIDTNRLTYSIPISTANGRGRAAMASVSRIKIGSITKRNFRAFVLEQGKLNATLLGMEYLNRLSRWEVSGDRMILHP